MRRRGDKAGAQAAHSRCIMRDNKLLVLGRTKEAFKLNGSRGSHSTLDGNSAFNSAVSLWLLEGPQASSENASQFSASAFMARGTCGLARWLLNASQPNSQETISRLQEYFTK